MSRVGAGRSDSGPVSRRRVRRAVGLAVAGSVLATAGLAAWVLSAVGRVVVPAGAAGRIALVGLGLVVAGALCGLAMIITVRRADRAARIADRPAAGGLPEAGGVPEAGAGLAAAAPPPATGAAPGPLPGGVPLAGRLPSRPDAEPAPQWPLEPAAEAPPPAVTEPLPQWSPEPSLPEPAVPEPAVPEPAVPEPLPPSLPDRPSGATAAVGRPFRSRCRRRCRSRPCRSRCRNLLHRGRRGQRRNGPMSPRPNGPLSPGRGPRRAS